MCDLVASGLVGFDKLVDSEEVLLVVVRWLNGVLQEILVPH